MTIKKPNFSKSNISYLNSLQSHQFQALILNQRGYYSYEFHDII